MKKILLIIILIASIQFAAGLGIGVSPSEITIDNALKGAEYERSISIFNTDKTANNYSIEGTGNISEWVSFYLFDDLTTEISSINVPGNDKVTLIVRFVIPEDTANANYYGKIEVKTIPSSSFTGSGQSMIVGANSDVIINVTGEQILDGVVTSISVGDTETGYPLTVRTLIKNTGNVIITPKIDVKILKDDQVIHSFAHQKEKIKPQQTGTINPEWIPSGAIIPDEYIADVTVSIDGWTLTSQKSHFKIFPIGTLTRRGNLTDILIEGDQAVGSLVKVNAHFQNTGEIDTDAKFVGEVYKDGVLVDKITSEELHVEKYMSTVLVSYLKLESTGDYLIKGKVIYSGKETPVKEVSLKAGQSTPGFEGIYLIAVMLLFVMFRGKKKSRKM